MLVLDNIKKENEEVYYSSEKIISLNKEDMNFLIELARDTNRKRVRLCCHSSIEEKVHEMVIVHPKNAYVRPHKHVEKDESLLIVHGFSYTAGNGPRTSNPNCSLLQTTSPDFTARLATPRGAPRAGPNRF